VLDLSIGWLDVKRISFYIHQQSLHQGLKNYEKLKDGVLLKDGDLFVFTDILNGSLLHILNLETEQVRILNTNINSLFFEKFVTYRFFDELKSNKCLDFPSFRIPKNGLVRKQIILAISRLNQSNWNSLRIHKIKFEDAQQSEGIVTLDLIYYLKTEAEGFPKVNFTFLATFVISSPGDEVSVREIINLGIREIPPLKSKLQMCVE